MSSLLALALLMTQPMDCKEFSPPSQGHHSAIGFAKKTDPSPKDAALRDARRKLLKRVCRGGGARCQPFRRHIMEWQTGESGDQVCAMATIRKDIVKQIIGGHSARKFQNGLNAEAKRLLEQVPGKRRKPLKVSVDLVQDAKLGGGHRAQWVAERVGRALASAGAAIVAAKPGAKRAPRADARATVQLYAREEGDMQVIEVTWALIAGRPARHFYAQPVDCPASVMPAPPSRRAGARAMTYTDPGLDVRIESPGRGWVCEGDRIRVQLTTDADLHVRVFNLVGDKLALQVFPNELQTDGRVRKDTPVFLGADAGFDIMLLPGADQERFLVIAAPTEDALPPLPTGAQQCLANPTLTKRLFAANLRAPGVRLTEVGFRVGGTSCTQTIDPALKAELKAQLEQLPACR